MMGEWKIARRVPIGPLVGQMTIISEALCVIKNGRARLDVR